MKKKMIIPQGNLTLNFLVSFGLAVALFSCTSHNWPQFRGPDNNMIAVGKDLPDEWGEDTNVRWTYEMEGEGWSSPIVWGERVFVTSVYLVKPSDSIYSEEIYRWQTACVDLESGTELWKKVAFEGAPRIKKHRATNYAGESPVTDGKRVYVYFGMTGVYCYTMDGELVWEKDLGVYNTQNDWGTGSSPLVYKGVLYVQVDNEDHSFLVALDAESGIEKWRLDRDEKTSYSTPVIWKNSVRTELVTGGLKARGYDPESGALYWELKMDGRYNIPSPVFKDDLLYIGNAGFQDIPSTLFAVKAGAEGDITPVEGETAGEWLEWSNLEAPLGNPSPLLYNGLLYTVSSRGGEITCMDAATGEVIYREKVENAGACWASPWIHGDKLFFYDEKGVTQVIRAGREFKWLDTNTLDDKFWTSVAITRDSYLFKGQKQLYCIGK